MLSRVAIVLIIVNVGIFSPVAASADDSPRIEVDVDRSAGPAAQDLAGVTWNVGDLSLVSPLKPSFVRTGARLDEISPQEGVLELGDLFEQVDTILRTGSRPLILFNRVPPWLARPVPPDCRQNRRDAEPCPPTAMGPEDLAAWEDIIENVVRELAERFDRDLAFELWNEPNSRRFWADSEQNFVDTMLAMHRAIAAVEKQTGLDMTVGGVAVAQVNPLLRPYVEAAIGQGTPPDFISWHDYTRDPVDYRRDVAEVRGLIPDPSVPLAITEWNYAGKDERDTAGGAAFNLASLIEMERAGVSQASFYRSVSSGSKPADPGLVTNTGVPRPSWWILQLWRSLNGDRLHLSGDELREGLWARATRDGEQIDVILSAYAKKGGVKHDVTLDLSGACDASTATVRRLDANSSGFGAKQRVNLESLTMPMASPSAVWVSVDCSGGEKATQITHHPQAPAPADDGRIDGGPNWLGWAGAGLVGLLLAAVVVGVRRRSRKRARLGSAGDRVS
jgi:hypothetical protein